jgi:rRNA-processing protein FCF1
MEQVILDTNFLMIPGKYKIDIFHELALEGYEPITLKNCIEELNKIAERASTDGNYARIALEMLEKHSLPVKRSVKHNADEAIIQYAKENNCAVATNDRELIEGLKTYHIRIIRLRQGKILVEE